MLEKNFQKKVIKYIESKGGYVINYNPGAVGKGGASDLLACVNGIFVSLELKVEHKLQQRQALNLVKVNRAGGVGIVLKESMDWKHTIEVLFKHSDSNNKDRMRSLSHINLEEFLNKVNWEG